MSKELSVNVGMELKRRDGDLMRHDKKINNVELCPACSTKMSEMTNSGDPMTIKSVVVNLLDSVSTNKNGSPLEGMEKRKRSQLADRIYGSDGPMELSVDDLSLLKQLVGDSCAPLVVGQVFPILDPALDK